MAIKKELRVLLDKKMDRKDFLKHVGIGVAAITGVSALAKAFIPTSQQTIAQSQTPARSDSYGGSAYGGAKTS